MKLKTVPTTCLLGIKQAKFKRSKLRAEAPARSGIDALHQYVQGELFPLHLLEALRGWRDVTTRSVVCADASYTSNSGITIKKNPAFQQLDRTYGQLLITVECGGISVQYPEGWFGDTRRATLVQAIRDCTRGVWERYTYYRGAQYA